MSQLLRKIPLLVFFLTLGILQNLNAQTDAGSALSSDSEMKETWIETERLMLSDLHAARNNARACLAWARKQGDIDLIEMGKFDTAVLNWLISGKLDDLELESLRVTLRKNTGKYPDPHSTMVTLHAIGMMLHHRQIIEPMDDVCRAIKMETDIRRRDQMVGTLIVAAHRLGRREVVKVVDKIGQEVTVFSGPSFWDQDFINYLVSSGHPDHKLKSPQALLDQLEKISTNTSDNNLYQKLLLNREIKASIRAMGRRLEEEKLHHECIEILDRIGATTAKVQSQVSLIGVKRNLGHIDEMTELMAEVAKSDELENLSTYYRCSLSLQMQRSAYNEEQKKIIQSVKKYFLPNEVQSSYTETTKKLEEIAIEKVEARRQSETALAIIGNNSANLAKELSFFRKFALVSSIATVAMIPWLILYLQQRRLNRANGEIRQGQILLKDLHLRITRMERTESLGLMAGSIAHDFNNILVGVMGNAELLQMKRSESTSDPFVAERINSIIGSAHKAADLARQMLAYAGRQQVTRKNLDLNALIQQNIALFESACLNQKLTLELDSSEIPVMLDSNLFERAVLNLITNASQASKQGSLITIRSGREAAVNSQASTMFGVSTHEGDFGFLEVIDHGTGISEADREHIFEPFYTKSPIGKGLGLSVVYGMVKSHNGMIQCISEPSKGTRFRIYLPISGIANGFSEALASQQPETPAAAEVSDSSGKTVLIIDDEEGVREVCKELFESANWRVLIAKDGSEGLEIAVRDYRSIDCILMDIVLPDLSANEILIEMESKRIPAPVVLMSGFSKIQLEKFRERINVVSILSKPFCSKNLLDAALEASRKTIECEGDRVFSIRKPNFQV